MIFPVCKKFCNTFHRLFINYTTNQLIFKKQVIKKCQKDVDSLAEKELIPAYCFSSYCW